MSKFIQLVSYRPESVWVMGWSQVTNPKPPSDEDLDSSPGPFAWNPRSEDLRYAGQQGYGIGRGDKETGAARVLGWSINTSKEQLNLTSVLLNNPIRHLIMFPGSHWRQTLNFQAIFWYGFRQLTIIHPTEVAKTILQMIPPKPSLGGYIPIH